MSTWRYIKGSEKDFEGAPEWAMRRTVVQGKEYFLPERTEVGQPFYDIAESQEREIIFFPNCETLIAQRERVTSVNDDRLANDLHPRSIIQPDGTVQFGCIPTDVNALITERGSKYHREIKPGVWVDVYDVLAAWSVTNPALQHLIKKALQPGERGHKDVEQDLQDILHSAKRAIELHEVKK